MEGGDDGVERVVDSKDLQQQSKALDKLTDRVEDRQLDSTRVQEAMASISASKEADIQAARLRNGVVGFLTGRKNWQLLRSMLQMSISLQMNRGIIPALSTLKFVQLIGILNTNAIILEQLDKKVAERTLREHKGDAVAAIRSLLY
ncbi:UNVERIFIED_CONTAM: hypothetical protein Scaly_0752500 [Sesamum calycinum]|uniref:Nascent polypeptide-associated complex subunit alpha-like UBA domain-containing protein n=1 Tax=Sesamum calycinum TaxID=2727403 RepID=A0AAW2R8U8_9LAMI